MFAKVKGLGKSKPKVEESSAVDAGGKEGEDDAGGEEVTPGGPVEEMEEGGWAEDGDEEWQEESVAETEEAAPEPPLKAAVTKDQQAAADKAFEDRVKKAKVQATSNNRCCISYARVVQEQEQLIREEKFKKKQANVLARREERARKASNIKKMNVEKPFRKMGIYESTTCWNTRTVLHFKDADSNGFFKGEGFNESSGYCFVTGQWFDDGDRGEILYRDKFGIAELNLSWDSSRGFAEYIGYAEFNKGRASFSKVQGDEALNRDYALIKDYALADLKEKVAVISTIKDNVAVRMRAAEEVERKIKAEAEKAQAEADKLARLQERQRLLPDEIAKEKADKEMKERPRPIKEIMQKIKELEAEKKEVDKALRSIESQKKQKQREAEKAAKEAARAAKAAGKKAPANETKKGPKGPPHALIAVPRGFLSDRRFVLAAFIEDETSLQFATPHVMDDPYFNLVLWHFKRLFKGGIREEAFKVFKLSRDGALPEVLDKQLYAQLKCTTEWKDLPPEVVEVGEVTAEIVLKTMERERLEEKEIWLERLEHGALAMTNAPRYLTNDYHFMVRAAAVRPEALQYADEVLLRNHRFMVEVVQGASKSMLWAAEDLKRSRAFVLDVAMRCDVESLEHVDYQLVQDSAFLRDARAASANSYRQLPEEKRRTVQFSGYGSLNAALDSGGAALVLGSYLTKLSDRALPLKHRRNLPKSAFYHGAIYCNVTVVVVSYLWATKDHPDPDGETLRDLARFLKFFMKDPSQKGKTLAVFMDWASLFQNKPAGSRSDRETALFNEGLKSVNLWYAHQKTLTVLCKRKPKERDLPYDDSGWPVFERGVSNLVKPLNLLLDLVSIIEWLEAIEQGDASYNSAIDTTLTGMNKAVTASRTLASAPKFFNVVLGEKTFTNNADKEFVKIKFTETFLNIINSQRELEYQMFKAPAYEWKQFVGAVLPQCHSLTLLNLSQTELQVDIREIVDSVGSTLKFLNLSETGCTGDIKIMAMAPKLEHINLSKTRIGGDISVFSKNTPNMQYLELSFSGVRGYVDELVHCTGLMYINLSQTRCMGDKKKLTAALPDCKSIILPGS